MGRRATRAGTSSACRSSWGIDFQHTELDIRDRPGVLALLDELRPEAIPFDDFDTNATGTLNLLEATR